MTRNTMFQATLSFLWYPIVFGLGLASLEGVMLMMVEGFQTPDMWMLGVTYAAVSVVLGFIVRLTALVLPAAWRASVLIRHAHYLVLTALVAVYTLDRRFGVDIVKRHMSLWGMVKIVVVLAVVAAVAIGAVIALRGLSRRRKLVASAVVAALFTGICVLAVPADSAGTNGTQVLLITVDSLRRDHVGCYGYEGIKTPHIDGLTTQGTRFAQAYTSAPYTAAAMSAISAGCYPFHSGVRNFGMVLDKKIKTLAEIVGRKGYDCVTVGGPAYEEEAGSYSRGSRNIDISTLSLPEFFYYNWYHRAHKGLMKERTASALCYLRHNRGRPYFLWIHYWDPHAPYFPPAIYAPGPSASPVNGSVEQLERFIKKLDTPTPDDLQRLAQLYDAEIRFVDDNIGMLVDMYRATASRRLLVLTADHGEALGEEGMFLHAEDLIEPMIRVPLIVHCSWLPNARPVVNGPVSSIDIMETILDGMGIGNPNFYRDGRSLLRLMSGGEDMNAPRSIYFESRGAAKVGIRRGAAKLVVDVKTQTRQLTVASEQKTATDDFEKEMLRDLLDMMKLSSPDQLKIYQEKTDKKMNKKLKTLGYFN